MVDGMESIMLGDVEVTRVLEINGRAMGMDEFFPDIPTEVFEAERDLLDPDFWSPADNGFMAAVQTWVLRSAGRTILVDTGVGNHKERPYSPHWRHLNTGYLDALLRAGVRPEDVDIVINTHLHVDHVGWNTRLVERDWVPTFPNATYLLPRVDFEFWNPLGEHRPKSARSHQNVFEDSVAPVHRAGLAELWEGERVIDENLRLLPAPGHTPGSSVLHLESGSDRAVFIGDLLHTPVQLLDPAHNCGFDEDPAAARASRRRLLEFAADRTALVVPAHFGGHGAAEVSRDGDRFAIDAWAAFERPRWTNR
ncbi:MBL fold metallo-hydrolase [Saccharopolyspora gregorii]|uniref:MBL fold metallo-hydrolase n=2 Tax=Saccharopolyspora gregorii TaxID=33914 RepID=A0ABP6S2H0_9PSEU